MQRIQEYSRQLPPAFSVTEYVVNLFLNVPLSELPQWQATVELVQQLAGIVATSATRCKFSDAAKIEETISHLFLDAAGNSNISISKLNNVNAALRRAILILTACNEDERDYFLIELFGETNDSILNECCRLFREDLYYEYEWKYLSDWFAIYRLLLNMDTIPTYLTQLETELQQYAAGLQPPLPTTASGQFTLPVNPANPYQRNKVLSGFLKQWGVENGFHFLTKLLQYQEQESFFILLSAHSLFKDCAELGDHGAWSHAIQWYIIIEHQKKTKFLVNDPLDIYQHLGDDNQKDFNREVLLNVVDNLTTPPATQQVRIQEEVKKNIWDLIFDQEEKSEDDEADTEDRDNFSCPEFITKMLATNESNQRWPLLSETVCRALAKKEFKFMNSAGYAAHLKHKHADQVSGVIMQQLTSGRSRY